MSKPNAERALKDNEAQSVARMLRVSPQKLNLVAALIRGKKVATALSDLEFSAKRISGTVKKTLESAIANAENNHDLDVDALIVAEAYVGKSIVMKRFHARGRGRASRIEKPFSHLTIVKINPIGFRLGINRTWDSRWFADNAEYGKLLHEDIAIRKYLMNELKAAGIAKVVIERPHKKCRVTIHSARPGLIIGKKGADIEKLRKKISEMTKSETHLNIVEVRKPEIDSTLVAQGIAQQLERRVAFRRAMKRAVQSAMRLGAEGIKITCAGRLGGAEIARSEWYREGRVPLHTLRADIDFGVAEAHTAFGVCGIKVWIFKGEILEHDPMASERR
eukprot:gene1618-2164_t